MTERTSKQNEVSRMVSKTWLAKAIGKRFTVFTAFCHSGSRTQLNLFFQMRLTREESRSLIYLPVCSKWKRYQFHWAYLMSFYKNISLLQCRWNDPGVWEDTSVSVVQWFGSLGAGWSLHHNMRHRHHLLPFRQTGNSGHYISKEKQVKSK